jgi:hypothetical protein
LRTDETAPGEQDVREAAVALLAPGEQDGGPIDSLRTPRCPPASPSRSGRAAALRIPEPSTRLVRAAAHERRSLAKARERLERQRQRLVRELEQVDMRISGIDTRLESLGQLVPIRAEQDERAAKPVEVNREPAPDVLAGAAIRKSAVRVLLEQPQRIEAIHYRHWYELLLGAGYEIGGENPLGRFLTQLTRSPVILRSTRSGIYALDREAPARIRRRWEELQAELASWCQTGGEPEAWAREETRRRRLVCDLGRLERDLQEAEESLRNDATAAG